jgi:hypothetical protein
MNCIHSQIGAWQIMFHGAAFPRFISQDAFKSGQRGASKFSVPAWLMVMAQRRLDKRSQLMLRGMFTLEPITEGGRGYPLLFQTGEAYEGIPLIDRQHPHDLFAEMAVAYVYTLPDTTELFAYFGLPGEPALGPPAFMHRPSAQHIPGPPLAHHWQDATHITFGVATFGLRHQNLKLDGSIFTGREPNAERYGFDRPRFDSYSFRLSANPSPHWALQVSKAFLKSPAELVPWEDQYRTTASVIYSQPLRNKGNWSTTLVWGLNELANEQNPQSQPQSPRLFKTSQISRVQHGSVKGKLHSFLLESDLDFGKQAFYTRFEWVQKTALDLGVTLVGRRDLAIGALTLGAAREVITFGSLQLMLGGQSTWHRVPEEIRFAYGRFPVSFNVYLRLGPKRTEMRHDAGY